MYLSDHKPDRTQNSTVNRALKMHKSASSKNPTKHNKSPSTDRTRSSGDRTREIDSQIGSTRKYIDQALITRYLKGSYIPDNAYKHNRRRQALDQVDVGLFHELQKLPRVRRERLDVAALALGVERVEGERALARAG